MSRNTWRYDDDNLMGSSGADWLFGGLGNDTIDGGDVDLYAISLQAFETLIMDIDYGFAGGTDAVNTQLFLFEEDGSVSLLDWNQFSSTQNGGGGSTFPSDAYLEFTPQQAGTFYIAVSTFDNDPVGLLADGSAIALVTGGPVVTAKGYSVSVVLALGTATVTVDTSTATPADIQTLVDTLSYQNDGEPPTEANRVVTITSLKDSGGTANSGVDTSNPALLSPVTVVSVNDAPTLAATGTNPTFNEGGAKATLFSAAAAAAVEAGQTLNQLVLTVSNVTDGLNEELFVDSSTLTLVTGGPLLTAGNAYSVSIVVTGTTATVSIDTSGASAGAIQTLIDGLAYENVSDNPTVANRVVTITSLKDSGGTANAGIDTLNTAISSTVNVQGVNDAPALVNNNLSSVAEGGIDPIISAELRHLDPEQAAASVRYNVTAGPGNGYLALTSAPGSPVSLFTQDDINNNRLIYAHDGSETSTDSFSFIVSDGAGGVLGAQIFSFSVTAVNDAPVNTVPAAQITVANTVLSFSTAGGNAIALSDADAGAGSLELTLTAANGTLNLSGTSGLTLAGGAYRSAMIKVTGTLAALNAALDGMSFTPTAGYLGVANLRIATGDQGNSGAGVALFDTDNVAITVVPPNAPPVINDQFLVVDENSAVGTLVGTVAASDPDASDTLSYSIVGGNTGGAFSIDPASGQVRVANSAALDFEIYASITLLVRVTDSGLPAFSDTANVTIQLNDLAEFVTPPPPLPPPPPPDPPPDPTPDPEPTPDPDADEGGGGTIGGTGGGGGSSGQGAGTPEPVSAAEGDDKSPPGEPRAEKPDEPVEKPAAATLRSMDSVSNESAAAGRSQLNSLAAAADEADEVPATEVEIAVAALVSEEEGFQEELDKVQDELSELAQIEATVVGSSAIVTTGLSVGYVVWLARGGMLLASLLSSMPAWRAIDPLPVLAAFRDGDEDDADDESLDSLVRKGGANKKPGPTGSDAAATPDAADPDLPPGDGTTA